MRFTLLLLILPFSLQAQMPDSSAFDFWTGNWSIYWIDNKGDTLRGENRVTKILDGQVIQENFQSEIGFSGKSWSVFSNGKWRQTWVDNQRGYLEFKGQQKGDTLIFQMEPVMRKQESFSRRMIFYNIGPDKFTWSWQSKIGDQADWRTNWLIYYSRKKD